MGPHGAYAGICAACRQRRVGTEATRCPAFTLQAPPSTARANTCRHRCTRIVVALVVQPMLKPHRIASLTTGQDCLIRIHIYTKRRPRLGHSYPPTLAVQQVRARIRDYSTLYLCILPCWPWSTSCLRPLARKGWLNVCRDGT